jgi:outer membrane protein assembly factor BamB
MKKIILILLFFTTILKPIFSQDELENLISDFPCILANYSILIKNPSTEFKIKWTRSEPFKKISNQQLSIKGNILFNNEKAIDFLSEDLSKSDFTLLENHRIIYKWVFELEKAGAYIITNPSNAGTPGFVNEESVVILRNGVISTILSGKQWLQLPAGKTTLYLIANKETSKQILIASEYSKKEIQNELHKKINSNDKTELAWVFSKFYPFVASLKSGVAKHIIALLSKQNKVAPFKVENSIASFFLEQIINKLTPQDAYLVESYIYSNFSEIYFLLFKTRNPNDQKEYWCSFFLNGYSPRLNFYENLIYDGKKELANQYFDKCIELINKTFEGDTKNKIIGAFYAQRFINYFRIGRIKEMFSLQQITEKQTKADSIQAQTFNTILSYFKNSGKPETEEKVVLTQSFDETFAFQMKEQIENYDGSPDQLSKIYKMFMILQNRLVTVEGLTYSFESYFHLCSRKNGKFQVDFKKFCLEKLQISELGSDVTTTEKILEKYESIIDLPKLRLSIMEQYFNRGDFLKSLSNAYLIADKYPDLLPEIASKIVFLESISHLPTKSKSNFSKSIIAQNVSYKGEQITIDKFQNRTTVSKIKPKEIGKLLNKIPLDPPHIQYWNHPWHIFYQPIEPLFTSQNIYFNGGSYLTRYSLLNNKIENQYFSGQEFANRTENGPHKKRFITTQAANQLFIFTNRVNSNNKTIKCFDFKQNLLWDLSDQKNASTQEPFCTPIEAQGKLFFFGYDKKETIKVINLSICDTLTGELISRTPISYLPAPIYDEVGSRRFGNWNTYTHDEHFIKDKGFVYGYTGTGVLLKIDANAGIITWAKGFAKTSINNREVFYDNISFGAPGFIKIFGEMIVVFMPDIQMLTGVNKNNGETIWQTAMYKPQFFHDRGKSDGIIFSESNDKWDTSVCKINPLDGKIIWQTSTNGLPIYGEGDLLDGRLYIPSEKSILVMNQESGQIYKTIILKIQPLKIRTSEDHTVLLTASTAFIFDNLEVYNPDQITEIENSQINKTFIEPDTKPNTNLSFENLNLELTLKIPETQYTSANNSSLGTTFLKTTRDFYHIMKNGAHLALFREGFVQKNGAYLSPEIIWYTQQPEHAIFEDTLYFTESGSIKAVNLFTFQTKWEYDCKNNYSISKNNRRKTPHIVEANKQFLIYQTEHQTICLLDIETKKITNEFNCPPINKLCLQDNYIIAMDNTENIYCFDISQDCKEIWTKKTTRYPRELFTEKGAVVVLQSGNPCNIFFYDIKTGALIVKASPLPGPHDKNRWLKEGNILLAFDMLYDSKTGLPLTKYKEGVPVVGGGFLGFFNHYGTQGNYILEGKEYSFQVKGGRDQNYANISAIRKGSKVTIMTKSYIETFIMQNDKLVPLEEVRYNAGSGFTGNIELQALDNSLLIIREDEMYFLRNFDPFLDLEKIKSFRVENKKELPWPYSELYPEIELDNTNWISFNLKKSERQFFYQLFSDEKFIYLKFKSTFQENCQSKSILYISSNDNRNIGDSISLTWNIDDWKNCQYSQNIRDNIESWKEIDIKGNTNLYIKIKQGAPFTNAFKGTLPDFNVEIRQLSNNQCDGLYRLGGAYHQTKKIFSWLIYSNDEAQNLKNYHLRSTTYEKGNNFYPQGEDLALWLKDRRRFYSLEDNIKLLNQMIEKNKTNYCVVNIITALLLEEISLLKTNTENLDELSDDFTKKLSEIISRLQKSVSEKGVSKEWADFALSFWTFELFPFKTFLTDSNGRFIARKAITGVHQYAGKNLLIKNDFLEDDNPLTPFINQPFLQYVFPSFIPGYPKGQEINLIVLQGAGTIKTGLGKITLYSPQETNIFCSREGVASNKLFEIITANKVKSSPEVRKYYLNNSIYDCFSVINNDYLNNLTFVVPSIKQPTLQVTDNQIADSIITSIENLPSDNRNGQIMVTDYLKLKGNNEDSVLINIYRKWLNSMRDNTLNCYRALKWIRATNTERKDLTEFMLSLIKESKLPSTAPRLFFVEFQNKFSDKSSRSVLGPIFNELDANPEKSFDPTKEYKSNEKTYKFSENLDKQKGGVIYLASKISCDKNEKVFLFVRGAGSNFSSSIFSIWLNSKPIAEKEIFRQYDEDTFVQKITLADGDNILLLKISGNSNYNWSNEYSFCIGDVFGAPIKNITLKPVH